MSPYRGHQDTCDSGDEGRDAGAAEMSMVKMSVNSTSAQFLFDSSNLSSSPSRADQECSWSRLDITILTSFYITNILLLLPLSILVLYVGFKRWRRQCSGAPAATASPSDIFTYHMVIMELVTMVGSVLFCAGLYADLTDVMTYGYEIFSCTWCAKMNFHSLTCVERYLAVVHPISYMRLKKEGGVRLRNSCVCCVWLLCLLFAGLVVLTSISVNMVMYLSFVASSGAVVCFCSLSVLRALRRPGPGETAGDKKQVDQMKRRAFNTVVTITGALLLCLGGMLVCDAVEASRLLDRHVGCAVMTSAVWFSLPGSLVLPLLFLHRAESLQCCKHNHLSA